MASLAWPFLPLRSASRPACTSDCQWSGGSKVSLMRANSRAEASEDVMGSTSSPSITCGKNMVGECRSHTLTGWT